MAEFLTMEDAESKFGKKGRTNAGLTLGIIGTALLWKQRYFRWTLRRKQWFLLRNATSRTG